MRIVGPNLVIEVWTEQSAERPAVFVVCDYQAVFQNAAGLADKARDGYICERTLAIRPEDPEPEDGEDEVETVGELPPSSSTAGTALLLSWYAELNPSR